MFLKRWLGNTFWESVLELSILVSLSSLPMMLDVRMLSCGILTSYQCTLYLGHTLWFHFFLMCGSSTLTHQEVKWKCMRYYKLVLNTKFQLHQLFHQNKVGLLANKCIRIVAPLLLLVNMKLTLFTLTISHTQPACYSLVNSNFSSIFF